MDVANLPTEQDFSARLHDSLQAENKSFRAGLQELMISLITQHNDNLTRIKQLLKVSKKTGEMSNHETPNVSNIAGRTTQALSPADPGRVFFNTTRFDEVVLAGGLIMDKVSEQHPPTKLEDSDESTSSSCHRIDKLESPDIDLDVQKSSDVKLSQIDEKALKKNIPANVRHRKEPVVGSFDRSVSMPLLENQGGSEQSERSTKSLGAISPSSRVKRLASYLGKEGRNLNLNWGNKQLLIAAKTNNLHMAKFIINQGTDVNVREHETNKTPLIIAAENNSTDVANLLVDSGANLELFCNVYSSTALLWAAWKNNYQIVEMLLKARSNTGAKNEFGDTALSIATDKDILSLLNSNKTVHINKRVGNLGMIGSKKDKNYPNRRIQSGPSGKFLTSTSREEEPQVKYSMLELSILERGDGKLYSRRIDVDQKSICKADDAKAPSGFKTSSKRLSLEEIGVSATHVKSMSLAEVPIEDYHMEELSDNRSEDSGDGYSSF